MGGAAQLGRRAAAPRIPDAHQQAGGMGNVVQRSRRRRFRSDPDAGVPLQVGAGGS
jgi:hypothetical protein